MVKLDYSEDARGACRTSQVLYILYKLRYVRAAGPFLRKCHIYLYQIMIIMILAPNNVPIGPRAGILSISLDSG